MKSKHAIGYLAPAGLLLASCLLPSHRAAAADVVSTWNGTTGNWNDFTKWSSNPLFPNNGNGGFTYDAIQNAGTLTVNQAITIEKYTFSGGTNTGAGFALTMNGLFTWTGGTMGGTGVVNANGGVSFAGSTKSLTGGRTLNYAGAATWTTGNFNTGGGAVFNNLAGASFDTNFDGSFSYNTGGAVSVFNNSATGTVNVNTGTLALTGSVTQHSGTTLTGGTWNVTNGASINITTGSNITTNQGNVTLDGPASSFARLTTALNNNQGSFTLKNDRDLTTAGALANSGSVNVDGAGTTLTIPGANAWWCISLEKSNAATLADRVARGDSGSSFSNQTHYRMSPFLDAAGFVCHWSARR